MRHIIGLLLLALTVLAGPLRAQETAWVQIEAHPTLAEAEERARLFARRLPDVAGFALGGGWYAVALGPYTRETAEDVLASYRAAAEIPRDSYIARASDYERQFWPIGAAALSGAPIDLDRDLGAGGRDAGETVEETLPEETLPEETLAEARRSEGRLTRAERETLQEALRWAGYYRGAIDAAFGPGTRGAMAGWQRDRGFDPTGVLTTRQRAALLADYNAVLEGLALETVTDDRAGIRIALPRGAVAFERYDYPFAHYESTGEVPGARVLLISQQGDRGRLAGLYEIMQTLEIVPLDGPRERDGRRFSIEGRDGEIVSVTEAALEDGAIKGFTLVWPAGDEARRTRLLEEMRDSFARLPGTLAPEAAEAPAGVDLVAGLAVRRPVRARSGFFVDAEGAVLTSAEAVEGCARVTLDGDIEARVVARDAALGAAVLRPEDRLAPQGVAAFAATPPRRTAEIAVAGYSYGGQLPAPTLTFGRFEAETDLDGAATRDRLTLDVRPGDTGGPVFDATGAVVGLLLPRDEGARRPPETVRFSADAGALRDLLAGAGIEARRGGGGAALAAEDLTRRAEALTVRVACWD
jgi:peptidoglycan hydrolase-like protein with peptidoglycan-binding domain